MTDEAPADSQSTIEELAEICGVSAFFVAAAKAYYQWPQHKLMSTRDYLNAIEAVKAIGVK